MTSCTRPATLEHIKCGQRECKGRLDFY